MANDFQFFNKTVLGFENVLREAERIAKFDVQYPPYNVSVDADEMHYVIELAVAGFQKSDLSVKVEDRVLLVSGKKEQVDSTDVKYVHQGISSKKFTRQFSLAEHLEVVGVKLENGILSISLEKQIPDEAKPKTFDIK